jgi:hypothetical protein
MRRPRAPSIVHLATQVQGPSGNAIRQLEKAVHAIRKEAAPVAFSVAADDWSSPPGTRRTKQRCALVEAPNTDQSGASVPISG